MTDIEFTKLEQARSTLESLEQRIRAIEDRQAEIPGELEAQEKALGVSVIGRLAAGAIHRKIEELEAEQRRLDKEALSLAPHYRAAEKALKQAEAEEAREKYMTLAAEAREYPARIYQELDQVVKDLMHLEELHQKMTDAADAAGRLAPVTLQGDNIFITNGAGQMLKSAHFSIKTANVKELQDAGLWEE